MQDCDFHKAQFKHQLQLVEFLNAELDMGSDFVSRGSKENGLSVIERVRRFADHAENPHERHYIESRLSKLEEAVARLR